MKRASNKTGESSGFRRHNLDSENGRIENQIIKGFVHFFANFRRFTMLALRTMAGDGLKDDVKDITSFFKRSSLTRCIC